jgi:Kef-type K+ transport system membrane component KefB
MSAIGHFLLQWILIVVAARLLVHALAPLRQPPVIGEILAGIALGPSLFGRLWPQGSHFVFAPSSLNALGVVSQLGLILFMFTVGLHTRPSELKAQSRRVALISLASIAIPFALGALLGPPLFQAEPHRGDGLGFALFCGIIFSVTAFPVLARIIHDEGLEKIETARLALSCAAVGDAAGWVILAAVLGLVHGSGHESTLLPFALGAGAVALFTFVLAPALGALFKVRRLGSTDRFLAAIAFLTISALCFELCGLHALFGAFLAGVLMPDSGSMRQGLVDKIEALSGLVLLPTFFAMTGLRTDFGLVAAGAGAWLCLLVIALAFAGKLGGTALAARLSGLNARESFFLGALMNTRGLMELVVLDLGLGAGIISPRLFTILVVMTLVTTMATGPLVRAVRAPSRT